MIVPHAIPPAETASHGVPMEQLDAFLERINSVIWHDYALYVVLGVGVLFTFWSGFCQYRALTHGVAVTRGKYDDKDDPGAINHFQALSAALSATVGLGNIGGVALAIALGGPGAVFWMWMIGLAGMALKTTEVSLSMIYRNTDDPSNPHGGPMFVASKGFAKMGLAPIGKIVGGIFVITLLISAITGGNMFQSWNVAQVTHASTNNSVPTVLTGIVLALITGAVIIGGIKRIGAVAGRLVPFMCLMYLAAALYVLILKFGMIPDMLVLIVTSAFSTLEAEGAFIGGAWGYAFLWGMKRALFSSEAGQGSSPIAHSAAKTHEPVREAVVAGLEPFIDTIVVCTITALVILSSGAWNRGAEADFYSPLSFAQTGVSDDGVPLWTPSESFVPAKKPAARKISGEWAENDQVFVIARFGDDPRRETGDTLHKVTGEVVEDEETGSLFVEWDPVESAEQPTLDSEHAGLFQSYPGASLTAYAFDRVQPGLGRWLVPIAAWLFAISTMISWSYYGEQGVVFLFGTRGIFLYKVIYCVLIIVPTLPNLIETDAQLDGLTALGTGVMLWANIPIMLIFSVTAMGAYHSYFRRFKAGEFHPHAAPALKDVVEGHDVE